jgi:hypothetical protein
MVVVLKRFLLVLGLMLVSLPGVWAQSTQNLSAVIHTSASLTTVSSPHSGLSSISLSLTQHQADFSDGLGFRISGSERQSSYTPSPLQESKTLFRAESRLPVAQVWGSRLQVNFFAATVHTANLMLGPLASIDALHRPRGLGSADVYGIGVSVPLGRDMHEESSKSLWRNLSRVVRR